jgi:hypothetical protein
MSIRIVVVLPAPLGAEQCEELGATHRQIKVLNGLKGAVGLGKILDFDQAARISCGHIRAQLKRIRLSAILALLLTHTAILSSTCQELHAENRVTRLQGI